jgi:hypothetical protein
MENNTSDQNAGQEMMSAKSRCWHWACCILPIVSLLLWLAAVLSVILSWMSVMNAEGAVWGYGPQWWIWNAVMFGILAMYGGYRKIRRCGGTGMCGCKSGCGCKDGACVCK